ncbi:MAG: DUF4214 domain-containing protein, partial [Acinetobacter sp.]
FGRPADEAGLAYWTTQLSSGAISQSDMNAFTNAGNTAQDSGNSSGAASSTNSGSSALGTNQSEFIEQIYQGLFGRSRDEAGLAYWKAQLASSSSTLSPQSIIDTLSKVDGNDSGTFNPSGNRIKEQLATLLVKPLDSNSGPKSVPDTDLTSADASKPSSSGINSFTAEAAKQALIEKLKQVTPAK